MLFLQKRFSTHTVDSTFVLAEESSPIHSQKSTAVILVIPRGMGVREIVFQGWAN